MDDYRMNGFISLGCRTDEDCMYYDEDGNEIITFQSCRMYPSKAIPSLNSTNGCICLNYIVTAHIDDNTGRIFCTKNDIGSIFIYIFDSIEIIFELFIAFRCLYILLIFGKFKMKQIWMIGMERDKSISLVKRNGLICLFLLMMNCLFFVSYRIVIILAYSFGIRSIYSRFKLLRFDSWPMSILMTLSFVFLGLCALHFTILWLSTTNALFSKEIAHNSGGCFNVTVYKRFINTVQILAFVSIIGLVSSERSYYLGNFAIFVELLVIIYEFVWGCKNITRLLRLVASWSKRTTLCSNFTNIGIHESDTAVKLLQVADKIDRFSSKIRKIGFFGMLLYGVFVICQFLSL